MNVITFISTASILSLFLLHFGESWSLTAEVHVYIFYLTLHELLVQVKSNTYRIERKKLCEQEESEREREGFIVQVL